MESKDCFYIFHWLPDEDRWEPITWDHWQAFQGELDMWIEPNNEVRSSRAPSVGIPGISGGIHYFIMVLHEDGVPLRISPAKYLIEPDGRMGRDNFAGFTRDDRIDYRWLMKSWQSGPEEAARLAELRNKMGAADALPEAALVALRRTLQNPEPGSLAEEFLVEGRLFG
jgi:hypothetical protein